MSRSTRHAAAGVLVAVLSGTAPALGAPIARVQLDRAVYQDTAQGSVTERLEVFAGWDEPTSTMTYTFDSTSVSGAAGPPIVAIFPCFTLASNPSRAVCPVERGKGADVDLGEPAGAGQGQYVALRGSGWVVGDQSTRLSGGSGPDVFQGAAGADTMNGRGGPDEFHGNAGTADVVSYDGHTAAVFASINGAGTSGAGCPGSGCEADTINTSVEGLTGGSGNDLLVGNTFANPLSGGGGDDTLRGAAGNDPLSGGAGLDVADLSDRPGPVTVDLVADTMSSASGEADPLVSIEGAIGTAADDALIGDESGNRFRGEGGNDTLTGGDGADDLGGGSGTDLVRLDDGAHDSGAITASLDDAANDGRSGEGDNLRADVENVTGGNGNTTFSGTTGTNRFTGGTGSDTVSYAGRGDAITASLAAGSGGPEGDAFTGVENLIGGAGGDLLAGTDGANRLEGGPGDDLLRGGLGSDALAGGAGTDVAGYNQDGRGAGIDADMSTGIVRSGGAAEDTLSAVEGLVGTAAADVLTGDGGDNALTGLGGDDRLSGGNGNDVLAPGGGTDTAFGGNGTDTTTYAGRSENLSITLDSVANDGAAGENDDVTPSSENVIGGSGDDSIVAGNLEIANTLEGGAGNDTLRGLGGNDALIGGGGSDTAEGGSGDDSLALVDGASDAGACGSGTDSVAADDIDRVDGDCEAVTRSATPPPFAPGPGTGGGTGTGTGSSGAPGAGVQTGSGTIVKRRRARAVTLRVTPRRDRRAPYAFVATGTIRRPTAVGRTLGCRGKVLVALRLGKKALRKRRGFVDENCRYTVALRLASGRGLPAAGRLKVTARFLGNGALRPRSARARSVRAG